MVRKGVAIAFVAFGLSRDPGCGASPEPSGGENAPCTRTRDCSGGLVCMQGVCVEPDGGSATDAGADVVHRGDAADDGG